MAFTPTTWNNGIAPGISAAQLNRIEQGIVDAHDMIEALQNQALMLEGGGHARAGAFVDSTAGNLTTTLTNKATVTFTKPALWNQYQIVAWGTVVCEGDGGTAIAARMRIGTAAGSTINVFAGQDHAAVATVVADPGLFTDSSLLVAVQVAEVAGNMIYQNSTAHYVAFPVNFL